MLEHGGEPGRVVPPDVERLEDHANVVLGEPVEMCDRGVETSDELVMLVVLGSSNVVRGPTTRTRLGSTSIDHPCPTHPATTAHPPSSSVPHERRDGPGA